MRGAQSTANLSNKLYETAKDAEDQLRQAGDAVNDGLRRGAQVASESLQSAAKHAGDAAGTVVEGAGQAGRETYRAVAERTGDAIAGLDRAVARNPVGALVAALGIGVVLGLLARR